MNRIIPLALSIVMGIMGCIGAGKPSLSNAQAANFIEQTSLTAPATASTTTTTAAMKVTEADTTAVEETTEKETTVKETTTKKVETTTKKAETTTKKVETTKKAETTTKKVETTTKKPETTKAKSESQAKKSDGYIWPADSDAIVTAGYPYYSSGSYHGGVDIALYGESGGNITENTHIYAAKDGVVVTAYNDGQWNTGFGNYCIIDHGNGVQTLYAHANEIRVSEGDRVKQGQIIGLVGDTGNTTAPHLHFEVKTESGDGYYERQNPMKFISEP